MRGHVEGQPVERSWLARPALELAPALLGVEVVHYTDAGEVAGVIVEAEAYMGPEDRAAHSYGGRRTARTEAMFGPPGHAYIFQIYGMHLCLNVVCAGLGEPQAVLVRALQPTRGLAAMAARRGVPWPAQEAAGWEERLGVALLGGEAAEAWPAGGTCRGAQWARVPAFLRRLTDGPGKLCQALGLTRAHYGADLTRQESGLFLRHRFDPVPPGWIARGPRINVDYAGPDKDRAWRFWVRGNPFVSA